MIPSSGTFGLILHSASLDICTLPICAKRQLIFGLEKEPVQGLVQAVFGRILLELGEQLIKLVVTQNASSNDRCSDVPFHMKHIPEKYQSLPSCVP
jgi:hypothetical protein